MEPPQLTVIMGVEILARRIVCVTAAPHIHDALKIVESEENSRAKRTFDSVPTLENSFWYKCMVFNMLPMCRI